MTDKVSILMAVYNDESNVIPSINSIINQSYNNWELIICDDCSTDNSSTIIKKFIDEHSVYDIKLIYNKKNSGCYVSFNNCILNSTGKYISLIGSDDIYDRKKIELQVDYLKSHPNILAVRTLLSRNNELVNNTDNESTVLYKKQVIDEIGYYDSVRFSGDSEFIYRMYKIYGYQNIPVIYRVLYYAKKKQQSLTQNKKTCIGSSPRISYVKNYTQWHNVEKKLYIPFPLIKRPFVCDKIMLP